MTCSRRWRGMLIDAACGRLERDRRDAFENHLRSCETCSEELASLRATLTAIELRKPARPEPGELDAWSRVAPRLDAGVSPRRPRFPRLNLGYPLAAIAAAALVALGVGLGRLLPTSPTTTGPVPPEPDVAAVVTEQARPDYTRFLERATPLLLAVANRNRTAPALAQVSFDAATEQRLAASLAAEAEGLGKYLQETGRGRPAKLVEHLQIVFLQMANLPTREYPDRLELVQATIEQRAILFQLTVEEMRRPSPDRPLG